MSTLPLDSLRAQLRATEPRFRDSQPVHYYRGIRFQLDGNTVDVAAVVDPGELPADFGEPVTHERGKALVESVLCDAHHPDAAELCDNIGEDCYDFAQALRAEGDY